MPDSYWTAPVMTTSERFRRSAEVERDLASCLGRVRRYNHEAGLAFLADAPAWARGPDGAPRGEVVRAVAALVEAASARPIPEALDADAFEAELGALRPR